MVKFELYSIVTEDFLVYIDDDDKNKKIVDISTIGTSHKSLAFNSSFGKRYPSCEICSMEECIIIKLVSNTNIHGRQWERRKTHIYISAKMNTTKSLLVHAHFLKPIYTKFLNSMAWAALKFLVYWNANIYRCHCENLQRIQNNGSIKPTLQIIGEYIQKRNLYIYLFP